MTEERMLEIIQEEFRQAQRYAWTVSFACPDPDMTEEDFRERYARPAAYTLADKVSGTPREWLFPLAMREGPIVGGVGSFIVGVKRKDDV